MPWPVIGVGPVFEFAEAVVAEGLGVGVAKGVASVSGEAARGELFFADIDQHPTAAAASAIVKILLNSI
ncbi:MAG: hypothetical protein DYH05_14690 [Acidobacteria bacterium ACB1]|nr:hypothetical protein [Acidobacteria bacterium ACB1]